jgi:hypothetical protein
VAGRVDRYYSSILFNGYVFVGERGFWVVTTVGRTEGRYEVQEVEFGRVYRWCPECLVVECDCDKRLTLTSSATTCRWCGADHASVVREELANRRLGDEALHPWRYVRDREDAGLPC